MRVFLVESTCRNLDNWSSRVYSACILHFSCVKQDKVTQCQQGLMSTEELYSWNSQTQCFIIFTPILDLLVLETDLK